MTIRTFLVDAFADRPFSGNPAAVCLLASPRDAEWMQAVAGEMNLSETALILVEGPDYGLRWLTPAVEVDLCGHATLAAAHVLWTEGIHDESSPICFRTRSGPLVARRSHVLIELDFPQERASATDPPAGLLESLAVEAIYVGKNRFDYLVQIHAQDELRAVVPDFERLRQIPMRGVIVTCRSTNQEYDFLSRFFAPRAGVDGDPVTGSAHCCLGPFWQQQLGRSELVGYQASSRGGMIHVRVGDERVYLSGLARTVLRGELVP